MTATAFMTGPRLKPVPTTVVTGFLGVGKTTAMLDLLENRPHGERWAVLVNEFGEVGIDGAVLHAGGGFAVREVAGGCICCSGRLHLRVALTRLLREVRPDRLLIEPTGLGHPAGIIDTLRDEWLAQALDVRATLCLVDPRQFANPSVSGTPAYQDQLNLADVLIANKTDLASAEQLEAFLAFAAQLYPSKLAVAETRHGKLDPAWLDLDPRRDRAAAFPDAHHGHAHTEPATGAIGRRESAGLGSFACGWVFPPETVFNRQRLQALFAGFDGVNGLQRAKGVFRTGREWVLGNWTPDGAEFRAIAYRRDSRVELIAAGDEAPDWDAVEAALMGAITSERRTS